jgi:hypothetical protein
MGEHLSSAQDVDDDVGTDGAPEESCNLIHALAVNEHTVNGNNHI